jgi:hypothetical protein
MFKPGERYAVGHYLDGTRTQFTNRDLDLATAQALVTKYNNQKGDARTSYHVVVDPRRYVYCQGERWWVMSEFHAHTDGALWFVLSDPQFSNPRTHTTSAPAADCAA